MLAVVIVNLQTASEVSKTKWLTSNLLHIEEIHNEIPVAELRKMYYQNAHAKVSVNSRNKAIDEL
jgi:hypothetical protein